MRTRSFRFVANPLLRRLFAFYRLSQCRCVSRHPSRFRSRVWPQILKLRKCWSIDSTANTRAWASS
jgi:hypothetical protein